MGVHSILLEVSDGVADTIQSFTLTVLAQPKVSLNPPTSITSTQVTLIAELSSDGGSAILERGFVYALTSDDASPRAKAETFTVLVGCWE